MAIDTITITGIEEIKQRLAAVNSAPLRRKILRKCGKLIEKRSKDRIFNASDLTGSAWAPRSAKTPKSLKNKKMERKLKQRLKLVFVDDKKAVIGFSKKGDRRVAYVQQTGYSRTISIGNRTNTKKNLSSTKTQAQRLRALGYKAWINGKLKTPTVQWIMANITRGKAGLIIRQLENRQPKSTYTITLPPRSFLGITNTDLNDILTIITTELTTAAAGGSSGN